MEKQEAVDFILQEFNRNRSQEEIAAELSQHLGAPQDVVLKFVARTLASYTPLPDLFSLEAETSVDPGTGAPSIEPAALNGDLAQSETLAGSGTGFSLQPDSRDQGKPAWNAGPAAGQPGQPLSPEEDSEFERLVLKALAKSRRRSDVVMMVCERYGVGWDRAQRLVARVSVDNRKQLVTRQNILLIPLSIVVILAGVALVVATASDVVTFYNVYRNPQAFSPETTVVLDRYTVAAFLAGIPLVLGGLAGLVLALRKQFE